MQATSGAKNVILLIDVSGSMSGNNIILAKESARAVVNTLSNNDFFGVVSFESSAATVYTDKLLRATEVHKESAIEAIFKLNAGGGTNFKVAFEKGFEILNTGESDEFGAPCTNG